MITLLTLDVSHKALAYLETASDQIAEEANVRDYGTRIRPLPGFLNQQEDQNSYKKYGYQMRKSKPQIVLQKSKIMKNRKKDKKRILSQTSTTDRLKRRIILNPLHKTRIDHYKTSTTTMSPDSDYDGWMPIVPLFQNDTIFDTFPKELQKTDQNVQPTLLKPISNKKFGRNTVIYKKHIPHRRKRNMNTKVAMKRAHSSSFSDAAIEETALSENIQGSEPSESHHIEYRTKIKHHHHHHHHKYIKTIEKEVPVKVPVIVPKPYPVEKKVPYPVEKIVHKYIEKKVPYPVEKKVPYPVEVKVPEPYPVKVIEKEYVPKPYPVVKHVPIIKHVEVKVPVTKFVPYPVEKKVPYPVEVKVPYPVEKKVPYPVEVEKKVPYPVKVYVPKPFPVEKKVPYPVEVKVKEPYPVVKHIPVPVKVYVDKPIHIPVPKPYPVEVEKKVPYPVEVEKKVHVPVKVYVPQPYPVEKSYSVFENQEKEFHVPELTFHDSDLFHEPF